MDSNGLCNDFLELLGKSKPSELEIMMYKRCSMTIGCENKGLLIKSKSLYF